MTTAGLIVAGGSGERMRRSGAVPPKPLVPIRGVTLLERNVVALLRAGIADLHVAVSANGQVAEFARSRCSRIAESLGATLTLIEETHPLGSIGAAAYLQDRTEVVVVNADNLSSLDLRAMVAAHQRSGAAMTIAVHDQAFPIPFGEIALDGDQVIAYREKPSFTVRVCSAFSVLGSEALGHLRPGETVGLPAFANRLLERGAPVRAYQHDAPWIDVNDLAAVERADALVSGHADEFELWSSSPDREIVALLLSSSQGVALAPTRDEAWCLPHGRLPDGDRLTAARRIAARHTVQSICPEPLTTFDEIDVPSRRMTRIHVFSMAIPDASLAGPARWFCTQDINALGSVSPIVRRALAAGQRPR
jgi:dTDP-glucose pyrophosphorylase